MSLDRKRIDEVRRLLVEAFMESDLTAYAKRVSELEELIGVPHGDRNQKANGAMAMRGAMTPERRKAVDRKRIHARWGNRSIDAELDEAGVLVYSIKYGEENE